MKTKPRTLAVVSIFTLLLNACIGSNIVIGPNDPSPLPTAPSTLPELIASLSDTDSSNRLVAVSALRDMGSAAEPAVPNLIISLSDEVSDIRVLSADALGEVGPKAEPAVPALIKVLKYDEFVHARVSAAEALGKIGDISAIPELAEILYDQKAYDTYKDIVVKAAWSIAQLTENPFPDSEPGAHGYSLNDKGEPLIIIAAREWWESKGKFMEWPEVNKK